VRFDPSVERVLLFWLEPRVNLLGATDDFTIGFLPAFEDNDDDDEDDDESDDVDEEDEFDDEDDEDDSDSTGESDGFCNLKNELIGACFGEAALERAAASSLSPASSSLSSYSNSFFSPVSTSSISQPFSFSSFSSSSSSSSSSYSLTWLLASIPPNKKRVNEKQQIKNENMKYKSKRECELTFTDNMIAIVD
jgi:hypothetical protein